MVAHSEMVQRIARLTPLAEVLALIETLAAPVPPQQVLLREAFGRVLAEDLVAPSARPSAATALRDGWAVRADNLADAGAYAPAPLPQPPVWLDAGDPVPPGADAVAPLDAIVWHGPAAEAVAPIVAGDGVLPIGGDLAAGRVLRSAGTRLRRSDIAALAAIGVHAGVVRAPRIRIARAGPPSPILDAAIDFLAAAVAAEGGFPEATTDSDTDRLDRALREETADGVLVVGGTGGGRRDASVRALARSGTVIVHGVAIAPGETAALGQIDRRPVLLVPGRIDSAIAIWLLIGRPLLARLCGGTVEEGGTDAVLSRKVASRLGLAEVVLVRRGQEGVVPLASDYLSVTALTAADGWILVPADSEGHAAGTGVRVRTLP
jgi:molybdopterin biosynthesis enzyme